jgi:hypothetical protein
MDKSLLTRRELLKILTATGGAVALASVPSEWKTPVVEVGALPAHAQGSLFGTIAGRITLVTGGPRTGAAATPSARANTSKYLPVVTVVELSVSKTATVVTELIFDYSINVPPGTYSVKCVSVDEQTKTGIVVRAGETTTVDFTFVL